MLAIALGLCAAWFGDGTTFNQPRPQSVQPLPSVVVPVAYWDAADETSFIPPAPLPEFSRDERPQIQFEFSQIESCSDSKVHPPAPPAELEGTHRVGLEFDFNAPDGLACEPDCGEDECGNVFCRATCDGPQTVSELHHLRTAINHLSGAGMPELTDHLREQYRDSVAKLRDQIQQELEAKQAELKRLQEVIQLLKTDLIGDARLEFQVEHWILDLKHLRNVVDDSQGTIQQAARFALDSANSPFQVNATRYRKALELLSKHQHVKIECRPKIRTLSGQEATIVQGIISPESDSDLMTNFEEQRNFGTLLKVCAEIQTDDEISTHIIYEHKEPGEFGRGSKMETTLTLTPGKTTWIGGGAFTSEGIDAKGVPYTREESGVILITPRIIRPNECDDQVAVNSPLPTIAGLTTDAVEKLTGSSKKPEPITESPLANQSVRIINPAFYAGDVPQHIQDKWDRATTPRHAGRTASTGGEGAPPASQAPSPVGMHGQKFHILRFVPAEGFPKMAIQPPARRDDAGIFQQPAPPPVTDDSAPTPTPSIRLHFRQQAPLTRSPHADPAATLDKLPPAPLPAKEDETKDDPET